MEKFDWKLTIRKNILVFKIAGLWPENDGGFQSFLYNVYSVIALFLFIYGHNFFQTINIYFIFPDVEAISGTFFVTLSDLLTVVKTYNLYKNIEVVKKLVENTNDEIFQPKNSRQRRIIEKSLNFWKKVCVLLATMSTGAVFFWAAYPILDKSIKEYKLPFLAWYPYNTKISPFYEITYIYQIFSVIYIASTALSTDMFIAALNVFIGAQCDILCDDLRHLSAETEHQLIKCIQHHDAIVTFVERSNDFFNSMVLAQFFTSATSIGVTMFQLTIVTPFTSEFYSLVSFGVAIVVEIFMYCWFGNEVDIKSNAIPYAAFESDWPNASLSLKRIMMIFVIRSQKSCKMSSFKLFYLSLETFVKILRTAWSYFALLHRVNSRK